LAKSLNRDAPGRFIHHSGQGGKGRVSVASKHSFQDRRCYWKAVRLSEKKGEEEQKLAEKHLFVSGRKAEVTPITSDKRKQGSETLKGEVQLSDVRQKGDSFAPFFTLGEGRRAVPKGKKTLEEEVREAGEGGTFRKEGGTSKGHGREAKIKTLEGTLILLLFFYQGVINLQARRKQQLRRREKEEMDAEKKETDIAKRRGEV